MDHRRQLRYTQSIQWGVAGLAQKTPQLTKLDITDYVMMENTFSKIQPHIVILTAALIHPLTCEENKTLAWKTNVDSVKKIVEECKKINSKLIFLSSDYVYSGKNSLIEETDSLDPLNYYGKTKLEGEKLVSTLEKFLIIRTAWVNDTNPNSKSFVMQVINSLKQNRIFLTCHTHFCDKKSRKYVPLKICSKYYF